MTGNDDETPAINPKRTAWDMHPEMKKISEPKIPSAQEVPLVAGTGNQQRVLEDILTEVRESLKESRLIRVAGQMTASHALEVFKELPALKKRMHRVELLAIGATLVNVAVLFVASCGR